MGDRSDIDIRFAKADDACSLLEAFVLVDEFTASLGLGSANNPPITDDRIHRMRTALAERDPEHLRHIVAVKNCDSDSGSHFDNNDGTKKPENRHKVLGYMAIATWYPSYFPKSPVSQLYIASIGSIPGAHVGSALINYARGLAREWGLQVIRLECAGGGKLEALYARQGFRRATAEEAEGYQAEQQLMILPVDGDSSPE